MLLWLLFRRFALGWALKTKFLFKNDDFLFKLINLEINLKHFLFRVVSHLVDMVGIVDEVLVENTCCYHLELPIVSWWGMALILLRSSSSIDRGFIKMKFIFVINSGTW